MRNPTFIMLLVVTMTALLGCTSDRGSRFLHDYKTVTQTADSLQQAPRGFAPIPRASGPTDFQPVERNVRQYMHSRWGWKGDGLRLMTYRPVSAPVGGTNAPLDASALLQQYFGGLERAGFTTSEFGSSTQASTESMEVASRSWSNRDRTLIVLGQIIRVRESGEIIASMHYWGTLDYKVH